MEQEPTIESMVIDDLANQLAALAVDRSAWRARAVKAEETLAAIKAEAEAEETEEGETEEDG